MKIPTFNMIEESGSLADVISDEIIVTDIDGIISDVNRRALEIHGYYQKEELVGQSVFGIVKDCFRPFMTFFSHDKPPSFLTPPKE